MRLHTEGKLIETEDTETQHGIFPGDPLSQLLFCISLILITEHLNKLNTVLKNTQQRHKYHACFNWMI